MNKSIFIIIAAIIFSSCNKGFDRLLDNNEYEDTTGTVAKASKVLFLVVDGARGEAVRKAQAPTLQTMSDHAIYSWNSISDTLYDNATAWADLLTGVHKEKHGVMGTNLHPAYPVFFKHIKTRMPAFRIAAFSAADSLGNMLITDADVNRTFGDNDGAVTAALLEELKVDSAGLIFGQFGAVAAAGKAYGYDVSIPEYKAAILQVDAYIGDILSAIKQRSNYAKEDWLVIVTSGNGGPFALDPADDDATILSNTKSNT